MNAPVETLSRNARIEVLDAAAACFAEIGTDASSLDDVARFLGATKGKIYHHFRSKADLIYDVRLRSVTLTTEAVLPCLETGLPPGEMLRDMVRTHVFAIVQNLSYHRVVSEARGGPRKRKVSAFDQEKRQRIRQSQRRYHAMYRDVVNSGIAQGEFPPQNVTISVQNIIALMNAPVFWYKPQPDNTAQNQSDIADQIADMVLGALGFVLPHPPKD